MSVSISEAGPLIYDLPLFVLLVAAVYTDLAYKKVYNWITIPVTCAGIVLHSFSGGWSGLFFSLAGCALGAGIFLIPYFLGAVGAGDVKLAAAIGALTGYIFVVRAIFYSSLIASLMAAIWMLKRGELKSGLKRTLTLGKVIFCPAKRKTVLSAGAQGEIPYAVAMVIGTFIVLLEKYLFY